MNANLVGMRAAFEKAVVEKIRKSLSRRHTTTEPRIIVDVQSKSDLAGEVAMTRTRSFAFTSAFSVLVILLAITPLISQTPASAPARAWADRVSEIEQYLKSADVMGMEDIGVGVTKPRKAMLAAGGPVEAIAWKPIRPGRYSGFWESYKSEIAAYELDKVLALGMVPPTVEKKVKGVTGAAVMWVSPVQSFKELGGVPGMKGVKGPPPAQVPAWNRQITIAKMFDNLIGNIDPNLGNWLVDPAWNLILIDHTRAFTNTTSLYHQLVQVDPALWDKMKALDEPTLSTALGEWLDKGQIKAILERRDKMEKVVSKLSAQR
jgi:hypothetical protein